MYKARFTHKRGGQINAESYQWREGRMIYKHPKGYFITLEFNGKIGTFRESYYPDQVKGEPHLCETCRGG